MSTNYLPITLAIAEAALSMLFSLFITIINGEPLITEQQETTIFEISNSVSISLTDARSRCLVLSLFLRFTISYASAAIITKCVGLRAFIKCIGTPG